MTTLTRFREKVNYILRVHGFEVQIKNEAKQLVFQFNCSKV